MTRLYLGKIGYVLGGLGRMQATSAEAEKQLAIVGPISRRTEGEPPT